MATTRPCKYCENPVAINAKTCPKCGGKTPYPLKFGEVIAGPVILCGLCLTCCIYMPSCVRESENNSDPAKGKSERVAEQGQQPAVVQPNKVIADDTIRSGSLVTIECPGEPQAFVAKDYTAQEELMAASRQNNGEMLARLVGSGRLYIVDKGIRATVIKAHFLTVEVELMNGVHSGKRGVVVNEWVKLAR